MDKTLIERPRLSDEIRARLEEMIASGEYRPGDLLPSERDLMDHFGVGRPAIREALFALHKMGLVALTNGSRPRVTAPSPEQLIFQMSGAARFYLATEQGERTFQDARVLFEVGLARHAAQFATGRELVQLEAALNANAAALAHLEEFERTDAAFHLQLALISKNPLVKAIYDALETWLANQRRIALMAPGALRTAYESHSQIYDAIASGNAERAEQVMREHLQSAARNYWRGKAGSGAFHDQGA